MTKLFDRETVKLKDKVFEIAKQVEGQVRDSVKCLVLSDLDLAEEVIKRDKEVDFLEVDIEEDCLKLLALHQPVANDLRLIVAALKINNDLERIGDLATNIAKCALGIEPFERVEVPETIVVMAKKTKLMLRKALLSFLELDAELARRVLRSDDEVDRLNFEFHNWTAVELGKSPEYAKQYLYLVSVSKHLERIADHASNVAEEVIYMREGEIVRHGRLADDAH